MMASKQSCQHPKVAAAEYIQQGFDLILKQHQEDLSGQASLPL